MKKSELKNFIREEIISTLSEDIAAMEKELDAYDQKLDAVIKKKEEAGLEEKVAKSVDDVIDPADYVEIGQGYLKGFKRPHSLKDDDLETLGRKIVKVLAKGDIDKAKAAFVNENINEAREYDADAMEALGFDLYPGGRNEAFRYATEELGVPASEILGKISDDIIYDAIHHSLQVMGMYPIEEKVNEDEDKEPSDAEIKKNKSLAKAAEELAVLTREMKSLAKKYSKAEGQEKEDLLKKLKSKTKLKKELDKILDK